MESYKEILRDNLHDWIEANGLKQTWVAEKCGISPAGLNKWLKQGAFPSKSEYLNDIAELIGVPVFILFIRDGVENREMIMKAISV